MPALSSESAGFGVMSLEGSWRFELNHGGKTYRIAVDDNRVSVRSENGFHFYAKWNGRELEDLTFWGLLDDGTEPDLPGVVLGEIESYLESVEDDDA